MSKTSQLFLGLRKANGQIGYLSESLTIPEFFDLICPRNDGSGSKVLIDFSPVIEALHSNHEKQLEQSIREKYNNVFNYWQESNSYSNLQIKLPKFESLSLLSNELITNLQFSISQSAQNYKNRRTDQQCESINVIKKIEKDINTYIDVLLCFIHSKASLEIESFKNDVVLGGYCDFLKSVVSNLFYEVVEYKTWNENFKLSDSSLLYNMAFEENETLESYTSLLPSFDNSSDLRLSFLINSYRDKDDYSNNQRSTRIEVVYRTPHHLESQMAKILRDLSYKIDSILKLLDHLKKGGVAWDTNKDSLEELKNLVAIKQTH